MALLSPLSCAASGDAKLSDADVANGGRGEGDLLSTEEPASDALMTPAASASPAPTPAPERDGTASVDEEADGKEEEEEEEEEEDAKDDDVTTEDTAVSNRPPAASLAPNAGLVPLIAGPAEEGGCKLTDIPFVMVNLPFSAA